MKIFLRWLLLDVLVFLGVVLFAQPVEQSFTPTQEENNLLWEISGKGLAAPSYLYGTIHMIPAENYFLTEATKAAFDKSTRIAFEIDTEEMTNPAAIMGLLGKMYMNNDTTMADLLTEEDYEIVYPLRRNGHADDVHG